MWLRDPMVGAALTNSVRYNNYNLTIIKPDGTVTQQIWPIETDLIASQYYPYTPDQVGNYTVLFSYPGQTYTFTTADGGNAAYTNDTFLSSSAHTTLTVQQQPIPNPELIRGLVNRQLELEIHKPLLASPHFNLQVSKEHVS
jgi:hypothetical protein